MARPRKSTKAVEVAEVEAIEPKTEEIKAEEIAEPESAAEAAEVKKPEESKKAKRTYKKRSPKAVEVPKEPDAPKEPNASKELEAPAKKKAPGKRGGRKAVVDKFEMHIQYGGREYSQEDLLKIAKDVWKYDLKQKAGNLSSVELYVKPEENKVYYVMNGDSNLSGHFDI